MSGEPKLEKYTLQQSFGPLTIIIHWLQIMDAQPKMA
jgi:hypothetical protein